MKQSTGFSLLEFLIVTAIAGIILSIGLVSASRIRAQQENSGAVHAIRQAITQGTTAASSRGQVVTLEHAGGDLILKTSTETLQTFELADSVSTNLAANSDVLQFDPQGFIEPASLASFPSPLEVTTSNETYEINISMIGEVEVEIP